MNGAIWGGIAGENGSITVEATISSSPATTYPAVAFTVNPGWQAAHVAHGLATLWNQNSQRPPAVADGTVVLFAGELNAFRVNGVALQRGRTYTKPDIGNLFPGGLSIAWE